MTRVYTKAHKVCEKCGISYPRHRKLSRAQWVASRYCSRTCMGEVFTENNATTRPSLREKFEARFERGDGCWEWTGTIDGYGYGVVDHNWIRYRAHVLALEFDGRPVPEGMKGLHHCDNPKCVRPDHLYPGTTQDNSDDAVERGQQPKGSEHHQAKLDEDKVREMRALHLPFTTIAAMFGVSRPTATRAIKRQTWRHVE